jgi:hypothetical protein
MNWLFVRRCVSGIPILASTRPLVHENVLLACTVVVRAVKSPAYTM